MEKKKFDVLEWWDKDDFSPFCRSIVFVIIYVYGD